jgi:ABC-2 type transport system permease protein
MAVYKRTYRAYTGPLTNPTWRFLVLQRYALKSIFRSRFLLVGYLACFIGPILALCVLYLNQNAGILAQIGQKPGLIKINGNWFANFLAFQGGLAGLLTAFVGPSLVAPDLTNGALSVYLSRPFSRTEYILGKGSVLGGLIASITLLPALILFSVQSSLSGWTWFTDNIFIAGGTLATCAIMTTLFSLLGLAMSAFVRWRIVAGALVLAVFAAGKGFGAVVNAVMRSDRDIGYYLDLQHLLTVIGQSLFQARAADEPISALAASLTVAIVCALLLLLINRKLKVCEVAG